MNEKSVLWGVHMSMNASHCDLEKITDAENIDAFTRTLVERIDMEPYGDPEIVFFGHGDKSGYTMQQLISTSNICAHFVDEYSAVFLDVFSCKTFDAEVVEELVKEFFGAEHTSYTLNKRYCWVKEN